MLTEAPELASFANPLVDTAAVSEVEERREPVDEGDTVKRTFDFVDAWLRGKGRF